MIELQKNSMARGLGIRLTGNKDGSRARMGVYVADIDPLGPACLDGRIMVGDELLEVSTKVIWMGKAVDERVLCTLKVDSSEITRDWSR